MKNPNQATVKTAKRNRIPLAQKTNHAPLPFKVKRPAPFPVLAANPLAFRDSFEIELDWIVDSMEPEVYQGNFAAVWKRDDMMPCMTELVLGLLSTGQLVFGAFNAADDDRENLIRIDFINPRHRSVHYREDDFQWLYPVRHVSVLDPTGSFYRLVKTIEFEGSSA